MRKARKTVVLLAESNFLLDVCMERNKDCRYLAELIMRREIQSAIPEYAFAESEAKLADIERARLNAFEQARLALRDIPDSALPPTERANIIAALTTAKDATQRATQLAEAALMRLRHVAGVIPLTPEILVAAHLRRAARKPPRDEKDLEIYESLLAFAHANRSPRLAFVFLQHDAAHFDLPELRAELAAHAVEIYFSAGEATQRVRALVGK